MSSRIFIDFETRSRVDLKRCGADVYSKDPSTEVLCVGYAVGDGPAHVVSIQEFSKIVIGTDMSTFVAHNFPFEYAIWNNVCVPRFGMPRLKWEQGECTLAMSHALGIPGSLEGACAAMGIKDAKDQAGQRIMLQLCKPRGNGEYYEEEKYKEKYEKLYAYCARDVDSERRLYKRLRMLSDDERKVWLLDQKINSRGIGIDVPAAKIIKEVVELKKAQLDAEMDEVTGGYVPVCTANAALLSWVKLQGVAATSIDKSSLLGLLNEKNLPEKVRKALLLRQEAARSSTAKLSAMLDSVSSDGRVRGTLQYHASHTGRWGGRKIQPQNMPRGNLTPEAVNQFFEVVHGYCD